MPATVGLCTDESVNERPFYVMEFVEGHILRSAPEAEKAFDEATRRAVGDHMADTLAALHAVDPDAVGLGDLARHDGYIERQLKRWRSQYDQMQVEGVDHGGLVERVSDELAAAHPGAAAHLGRPRRLPHGQHGAGRRRHGQGHLGLGDLHAGRPPGRPRAAHGLLGRPDRRHGRARAVADHGAGLRHAGPRSWSATTRCPISTSSNVGYYIAFGYWKLGCILQGVYARYVAGAGAGDQGSVEGFPVQIGRLFEMAADALETAP